MKTSPKLRYGNFLHSDCGLTFAEYLGIDIPKIDFESRGGKYFYQYRSSRAQGEWFPTMKEAKASYKSKLKDLSENP